MAKSPLRCEGGEPRGAGGRERSSSEPRGDPIEVDGCGGGDVLQPRLGEPAVARPAEVHVVLEATAAYHELAAYRLVTSGLRVSIVNSARVRSFGKGLGILGKTDPIDARLLARYGHMVSPRAWRPPARVLLDLEALLARLDDVEGDLRREESRLEQARTRGCPALVESSLLESIEAAKGRRGQLRRAIAAQVAACPELRGDLDRLLTIPAVGPRTATRILVLLRTRAFKSARQAAACLGRGKCKMSALVAAMRKLVHLCFGVLRNAAEYRPFATSPP